MTFIRLVRNWSWPDLLAQTPGHSGEWGNVRFSEADSGAYDFCVVLNHPQAGQTLPFPAEKVVRLVQEPPVEFFKPWHVNPAYAGLTMTCDPQLSGQEYRRSNPLVPWHINRDLDFLRTARIPAKTAVLSWITSTKAILAGHRKRMDFLQAVSGTVPELELLGTRIHHITNPEARARNAAEQQALGFGLVEDKWAGLAPYRYSLAIENFSGPDYWTEKLADCFLAWTLPFYYGCPNIEDYFPADSMVRIDIDKPEEAAETIRRTLRDDTWRKRLPAIAAARKAVLERHQLFPALARHFSPPRQRSLLSPAGKDSLPPPELTVVICTYNRRVWLGECLEALAGQTLDESRYEIVVVDNGSRDETRETVRTFRSEHPNCRYVYEPELGLSHARNRGVDSARTEYIAFVDDDSQPDPHWLSTILRIIGVHNPDIVGGAVGPMVQDEWPTWFREQYAVRGDMGESGWLDHGYIMGTNIVFRKSLLREYGGFSPHFGMHGDRLGYHEETQLVMRAIQEKRKVYYSRDLVVKDRLLDYKKSFVYYLYAKYRAGYDGLELWNPAFSELSIQRLPALIERIMERWHDALTRRDCALYPHPENYLLETDALSDMVELGLLTAYLRKNRTDPVAAVSGKDERK